MKNIILFSGGLDSVTLLYKLLSIDNISSDSILLLLFNYGQKAYTKELEATIYFSNKFNIQYKTIDITNVFLNSKSSILLNNNNSASSQLEQRNFILISCASSIGEQLFPNEKITIYIAIERILLEYPDCDKIFIERINFLLKFLNQNINVSAPFVNNTKEEVIKMAKKYKLPIHKTWSCYESGPIPCGKCDACIDRRIFGVFNYDG